MAAKITEERELVLVEWADSYGVGSSWAPIPAAIELRECLASSVGWVVAESATELLLVPHVTDPAQVLDEGDDPRPQGCGDMTIPKSAIRRRVSLREVEPAADDVAQRVLSGTGVGFKA